MLVIDFQYPQPDRLPYNLLSTVEQDFNVNYFQYPQPDRLPYNVSNIGCLVKFRIYFQYPQPDRLPYNHNCAHRMRCTLWLSVSSTGSTSLQPHQFQTRTMPKFLKNSDTDPLTTFSERQISPISLQQVYHRDTHPKTPFCPKTRGGFSRRK